MKLFYMFLCYFSCTEHITRPSRSGAAAALTSLLFHKGGPGPQQLSLSVLLGLDVTQFRGRFSSAAQNTSVCPGDGVSLLGLQ